MKVLIISEEIKQKGGGPGSVANLLYNSLKLKNVDIIQLVIQRQKKIKSYYRIIRVIFQNTFDVINIHSGNLIPFILMLLPYRFRKKIVLTQHGYTFGEKSLKGIKGFVYKYGTQFSMKRYWHIVFVSNKMYSKLSRYISNNEISCVIIHNGFEKFNGSVVQKKNQFVFVGGKTWAKGLDQLLESLIKKKILLSLCIIGGGGPLTSKINRLISNFISIGGRVTEYGIRDKNFVQNVLAESKYLICPSRFDSFNVTVLEAMYNKCIVLTLTEVGASELIVHNYNGLKFDSIEDLVNFVSSRLSVLSAESEELIIKNAVFSINDQTWDKVSDKYLEIFNRIHNI